MATEAYNNRREWTIQDLRRAWEIWYGQGSERQKVDSLAVLGRKMAAVGTMVSAVRVARRRNGQVNSFSRFTDRQLDYVMGLVDTPFAPQPEPEPTRAVVPTPPTEVEEQVQEVRRQVAVVEFRFNRAAEELLLQVAASGDETAGLLRQVLDQAVRQSALLEALGTKLDGFEHALRAVAAREAPAIVPGAAYRKR